MKKLYESSNISAIAQAIREKNGLPNSYKTSDMAQAIREIPTGTGETVEVIPDGYILPTGTKEIDENGIYDVSALANVSVNVPTAGDGGVELPAHCQIVALSEDTMTFPSSDYGWTDSNVKMVVYSLEPLNRNGVTYMDTYRKGDGSIVSVGRRYVSTSGQFTNATLTGFTCTSNGYPFRSGQYLVIMA